MRIKMAKIIIIDASNLIFRAFFGMKLLTTSTGIHVNAVYGALRILKSLINEIKPDYLVAVWDSGKKTFRSDLDPNYKAQRPPVAPELKMQFSLLKEAFDALGIPHMTAPIGIEGDDLTGTMAVKAASMNMEAIIFSEDKDFFSLCGNSLIKVYSNRIAKQFPDNPLIDKDYIINKYAVKPEELVHVKALMGEKTDNIMGIKGIGPKTATSLILKHKTIQALFKYLENNPDDKYYYINEHREIAELALKLAIIKTDVEVEEIKIKPVDKIIIDEQRLRDFFVKLEMTSFLKENFPIWKNLFNYQTKVG